MDEGVLPRAVRSDGKQKVAATQQLHGNADGTVGVAENLYELQKKIQQGNAAGSAGAADGSNIAIDVENENQHGNLAVSASAAEDDEWKQDEGKKIAQVRPKRLQKRKTALQEAPGHQIRRRYGFRCPKGTKSP